MSTETGSAFRNFLRSFTKSFVQIAITIGIVAALGASPALAAKYAGFVVDAKTGKVLYSRNADSYRHPASLTKMMTLYLVFEDLKAGRISKKSRVRISRKAAREQPSKLGIKPGRSITVEQAIYALVTKSANDVATALAEKLAGSTKKFAARMTRKARQLGMRRTTFKNAHGLTQKNQLTTARDMATLGLALREHFPRQYRYFQTRSFKFGRRRYSNHNRLLGKIKGVDGIKTGYTRAAGYNLVTSVSSGRRRIVAVVLGGKSGRARNAQMAKLIKRYLRRASRRKARTLVASARSSTSRPVLVASAARPKAKAPVAPVITPKARVQIASVLEPKAAAAPKFAAKIETVPVPQPRAVALPAIAANRVEVAHNAGAASRVEAAHSASASTLTSYNALEIKSKLAEMAKGVGAQPVKRPKTAVGAVNKFATAEPAKPHTSRPTGWHIQIGATPNLEAAEQLLTKARSRGSKILASASPYTETVVKGNATLYRARFVGFQSKSSARRACKYLKKRNFACLAISS